MACRKIAYWLIIVVLVVGALVYGFPRETPTFRIPIWMPNSGTVDDALAKKWFENPSQRTTLEDFKSKKFSRILVMTSASLNLARGVYSTDSHVVYLGSFFTSGGIPEWASIPVADLIPWTETWTRAIAVGTTRIDPAGFVVVETAADYWYTFRLFLMALGAGLFLDFVIAVILEGKPHQFYLQWPMRVKREQPPQSETDPPASLTVTDDTIVAKKVNRRKKPRK